MISTRTRGGVLLGALVVGVVVGSLPSCGGSSSKSTHQATPCMMNSDCSSPLVCGLQRCHTACRENRDCPDSERCLFTSDGEICQLPDEEKCHFNSECKDPKLVCAVDGVCRSQCLGDVDCPAKQECLKPDLVCVAPAELVDGKLVAVDGGGTIPGEAGAGNVSGGGGGGQGGKSGVGGTSPSGGTNASGGASGAGTIVDNAGAGGEAGAGVPKSRCPFGLGDCDSNPNDCETDLTLSPNCGACNAVCQPTHGAVSCDAVLLKCVVTPGTCDPGYADCNQDGRDGCESIPATDAKNCGTCGHTCGGGTCTEGKCSPPVFLDPSKAPTVGVTYGKSSWSFLQGSSFVELNADNGTEIRTATLPTTPATIAGNVLATSSSTIFSVGVDSTNVYYGVGGNPSAILYKPLNGTSASAAKTAATLLSDATPNSMALTSTGLYIAVQTRQYAYTGSILSADKTALGTTASFLPGLGSLPHWPYDLHVAAGNLFWEGFPDLGAPNDVYTAPVGGGTPVFLAHVAANLYPVLSLSLTTDSNYAYWNTSAGTTSKIQRVAAKGSPTAANVEDVVVGINAPSQGLVVDATYVYYLEGFQLYRAKKDGSTSPEPLGSASAAPNIYDLFGVDGSFVYGTGSGGQIVGLAKDALGV